MIKNRNVLEAARDRVALVFDRHEQVVVSVSGGKDSTVLFHLAVTEARRRNRRIGLFFLDQEAEYESTIEQIRWMMTRPNVDPQWLQIPLRMTNATSHCDMWLNAWGPGESWIREHDPLAIVEVADSPDRFYDIFPWWESRHKNTAFFVGLRARESLHRWRAMIKNPGAKGVLWSTRASGIGNVRYYPLFDWWDGGVWKYIADHDLPYNRAYDRMMALGKPIKNMRVSNLIHEQAFRCLAQLQELEPDTYEKLLRRIGGIHTAALYSADRGIYDAGDLPEAHESWRVYRDYLLDTTPADHIVRFRRRFARQGDDEATCKEHVRQILMNDWENNVPVRRIKANRLRDAWWDRL